MYTQSQWEERKERIFSSSLKLPFVSHLMNSKIVQKVKCEKVKFEIKQSICRASEK